MLLEPGCTKNDAVLANIGDKEVDTLMVCSNSHRDRGGLVRDGAGFDWSPIRYVEDDWMLDLDGGNVEFIDQGLIDEALGGS